MLGRFDLSILYFVNHDIANPVFDFLFIALSESRFALGLLVFAILSLAWRGGAKGRLVAMLAIVAVAITDPMTHYILKKLFAHARPCHSLSDLRLIAGCGGLYGFPSNHAANSAALAMVFSFAYRRLTALFAFITVFICISRIYLGKHYPSDVVAGVIFGMMVAVFVIYSGKKLFGGAYLK